MSLNKTKYPTGWIDSPRDVFQTLAAMPRPVAAQHFGKGVSGSGKGKTVLLYEATQAARGSYPILTQEIGDCVSMGFAKGVMTLAAVQIIHSRAQERYEDVATEPIYGGSRVEVGGGRLGNSDGSIGAWAAKWVMDWGILKRKDYGGGHDLTRYSGARAKDWGRRGVPDHLEPVAREHPVRTASLVRGYEDCRDALANGYPVVLCSVLGFTMRRDNEGFIRPSGRWGHCTCLVAVDDAHRRPGCLMDNSWGANWVSGPKRHDQPDGTAWIDADAIDRMCRENDSYALSGFKGFPKAPVPLDQLDWSVLWK